MIERGNAILFGSFGGWNSGDEAILDSVERLLGWSDTELPSASNEQAAVICFRTRDGFAEQYRARGRYVVLAKDLKQISRLLRSRQLIIGGGQIITGDRSYKGLVFLLILTSLARWFGKPAVMVGIGAEGVHRRLAKWLCRRIVLNVSMLNCRDQFSQTMLSNAGCDPKRLRLSADVVLSGVIASDSRKRTSERPSIAIGLHHANWRVYSNADEFVCIAETIAAAFVDYDLVLVSNDCRHGFDEELLRQLQERIKHPRIRFQPFDTVENVLAAYASAKCVISVRMHPLILGLIHGVPVVGIARSNKVKQLANRVGFDLIDPQLEASDDWIAKVRNAIANPASDLSHVQRLVHEQFQFEMKQA